MNAARPFRFCSATGVERLRSRMSGAFSAWAEGRFEAGSVPAFTIEAHACDTLGAHAADAHVPCLSAHGVHGSFWVDAEQSGAMQVLLFGAAGRSGSMTADIARTSLAELLEAISDAAPRPCAQEVIDLSVRGRALAIARIRCQAATLEFVVELPDPSLLSAREPRARVFATSASALLPHEVSVRATLGAVEVDLGTLHLLRPGDILRLDKRLDESVELDIAGERLHCEAFLVASGQRKAVELGKPQNPPAKDSRHA